MGRISRVYGIEKDVILETKVKEVWEARAVDVGVATITFEVTGAPDRLADFLQLMSTYGVVSLAKSGRIALPREQKSAKKHLKSA